MHSNAEPEQWGGTLDKPAIADEHGEAPFQRLEALRDLQCRSGAARISFVMARRTLVNEPSEPSAEDERHAAIDGQRVSDIAKRLDKRLQAHDEAEYE